MVAAAEAVDSTAAAHRSTAAAVGQAAQRFIPAAFEPVAEHSEAARFTAALSSTAVACGLLIGITFTGGSSTERPTIRTTTTIPIITRTAAAPLSGPTTVGVASVTSATGVIITGVTITTTTTIASIGEHRADR